MIILRKSITRSAKRQEEKCGRRPLHKEKKSP